MVKLTIKEQNTNGVVQYGVANATTDDEFKNVLPKKNACKTTSTAEGIVNGVLTVYYFTEGDGDNDGVWTKIS